MTLRTIILIAGICLLIVTLIEVFEERGHLKLKLEHGLLIYAIAHVINKAVEVVGGMNKIREHRRLKSD